MAIDVEKLKSRVQGDVLASRFDQARYATDASIYQIQPMAVLVSKTWADVDAALAFAKEQGIALLPRMVITCSENTVSCANCWSTGLMVLP